MSSNRTVEPAFDLIVIGDCNPDVLVVGSDVTPAFGQEEKLVDSMSLVAGGSAAITAVAAARLGLRVALVAAIGADAAGDFMLGELASAGVDTGSMPLRAGTPTGMTVALSRGDDRAILTAPGTIGALTQADLPAALLARTRHVHVSSYFLLEQSLGPALAAALADARAGGATTSLDTNWDPAGAWGAEFFPEVLAQTDLLLPNEAEAERLAGVATLPEAVASLTKAVGRIVVKLGARGALYADGPRQYLATLPQLTPVDTTGAGDCFNAGLLTGLLRGLEPTEALALACATGALSTQGIGGSGYVLELTAALELAREVTVRPGP
ncbi:MAG TPA: carbohydrate kinase family protein [Streptosporangiaceae bacterium]|nr:carbohydrate kinase family protein [Streptosporangiaceae bacterium]